jgi:hypothetical protein
VQYNTIRAALKLTAANAGAAGRWLNPNTVRGGSPAQAMKSWQESHPELFNIEIYNQAGLDGAVLRHDFELLENLIEVCAARKQNGGRDNARFMKCSEGVKVSVKGLVFTVPFQIEGHAVFHEIYFVPIHEVVKVDFCEFFASVGMRFDRSRKPAGR